MKSLFITLTICAVALLSACTEPNIIIIQCNVCTPQDGTSGDQPPPLDLFIQATIDGQLWRANINDSTLNTPVTEGGEIVALNMDSTSQITLRLPKYPVIGEVYQFTSPGQPGESSAFYTPNPSGTVPTYYESTAGSVTIKGIDSKLGLIGGTFEFTGTDAKTGKQIYISDGVFILPLP
jgi:hypothetical protein